MGLVRSDMPEGNFKFDDIDINEWYWRYLGRNLDEVGRHLFKKVFNEK